MKVKEESEKAGLKFNTPKTNIMASGPITSWQIDGETVETVTDFIFLGSKITADGDCSHEIKRCLLLGRKGMTNLDSILKNRDITLPTKVHLVKAMVFPGILTQGLNPCLLCLLHCREILYHWATRKVCMGQNNCRICCLLYSPYLYHHPEKLGPKAGCVNQGKATLLKETQY